MKTYTGVGSREISDDEWIIMLTIGRKLNEKGYTLRSGAAAGADSAFEEGAIQGPNKDLREIYIPWKTFSTIGYGDVYYPLDPVGTKNFRISHNVAADIHPAFFRMKRGGQLLHQRNIHQVMGIDLVNPVKSDFLLACSNSSNGVPTGGTRTAWVLAARNDVPCFNIRGKTLEEVKEFLIQIGVFGDDD